jgi:hypothetical protein
MSALSFSLMTQEHRDLVRDPLAQGKRFTFLSLRPCSPFVQLHAQLYLGGLNLKSQIGKALIELCNLKSQYPESIDQDLRRLSTVEHNNYR